MHKPVKHNELVVRLSRFLTASLSVSALMLSLAGSSLLHVHKGGGHGPDHSGFRGTLLHSHLPEAHSSRGQTEKPSVDAPSHDGASIDLFLSLAGNQVPLAVGARVDTDLIPHDGARRVRGAYRLDRTRDPPLKGRSPRAPPA